MENNNEQEQPTQVVQMNGGNKAPRKNKTNDGPVNQAQQASQPKMFLISEQAVNQLLNTVAELPGLTWKITNPIIAFIQQNVTPFQGQ